MLFSFFVSNDYVSMMIRIQKMLGRERTNERRPTNNMRNNGNKRKVCATESSELKKFPNGINKFESERERDFASLFCHLFCAESHTANIFAHKIMTLRLSFREVSISFWLWHSGICFYAFRIHRAWTLCPVPHSPL